MGSFAIGLVLIAVAIFLYIEVKSLLLGESADPIVNLAVTQITQNKPEIINIINCITIQQGPGEVLLCFKVKVKNTLTALDISLLTNQIEKEIRAKLPEVKWIYMETDLQEWK